jgi:ABC-2 type transport system permease protein
MYTVQIAKQSVIFAVAEMRAVHTWRTWLFGWLARLLVQAAFFALIGRYIGNRQTMQYVLVGNIIALTCLESMVVVLTMVQEREGGTLPLLAISPASHVPIYLSRGLHWMVSGIASGITAWLILPPLLGVPLPWPQALYAIPIIPVVSVTSYCYGCLLSSFAVRWMGLTWITLNLGYLPLMAYCGVNVPVTFWPGWVQAVVQVLPLTHGLAAIRTILVSGPVSRVLSDLGWEVLVGAGWLGLACLSINQIVARGRVTGSLEFGS